MTQEILKIGRNELKVESPFFCQAASFTPSLSEKFVGRVGTGVRNSDLTVCFSYIFLILAVATGWFQMITNKKYKRGTQEGDLQPSLYP